MEMNSSKTKRFFAWLTLVSFFSSTVSGAVVDIASVPLVSMSTKVVRPNVMFILDDSIQHDLELHAGQRQQQQHQATASATGATTRFITIRTPPTTPR